MIKDNNYIDYTKLTAEQILDKCMLSEFIPIQSNLEQHSDSKDCKCLGCWMSEMKSQ